MCEAGVSAHRHGTGTALARATAPPKAHGSWNRFATPAFPSIGLVKSTGGRGVEMVAGYLPQGRVERIAAHLREAQALRKIAAALSLRQARATVLQAAIEHERNAALLQDQ